MDSPANRRSVRNRPGRVLVPVACLVLLLSACTSQAIVTPAIDGDWAIVAAGGVNDLGIHAVYASRVTGGDQIEVATRSSDGITSSNPVLYDG